MAADRAAGLRRAHAAAAAGDGGAVRALDPVLTVVEDAFTLAPGAGLFSGGSGDGGWAGVFCAGPDGRRGWR